MPREPHRQPADSKPKCRGELYQRVAPRDSRLAIAATGAEVDPTEQRDIVVPADHVPAARAVRAGFDDIFVIRQSADAHIQKAAESKAKNGCRKLEGYLRKHGFSIGRDSKRLRERPYRGGRKQHSVCSCVLTKGEPAAMRQPVPGFFASSFGAARKGIMRLFKYFAILAVFGLFLGAAPASHALQVSVGIGVGAYPYGPPVYPYGPPVCTYGYYGYAPYACAPYGYYGPQWFVGGVFIGAGPWYGHGYHYGHGYMQVSQSLWISWRCGLPWLRLSRRYCREPRWI